MIQFGMNNENTTHPTIDTFTFAMNELLDGKTFFRIGLLTIELNTAPHASAEPPVRVRLIAPTTDRDEEYFDRLRNLAYHLADSYFSETTNDDACEILVRERRAHFYSDPTLEYLESRDFASTIVIDATVEDYLT